MPHVKLECFIVVTYDDGDLTDPLPHWAVVSRYPGFRKGRESLFSKEPNWRL